MAVDKQTVLAERMERQGLARPVTTPDEYSSLFRRLQPVPTIYFAMPGIAPSLVHRTTFDDMKLNDERRASREIVKGRFLNGTIGYVFADDLALYGNAFQRPLERLNSNRKLILDTLRSAGPMTPRRIKEETGLLNKEIMPALHRLQEAFLVYEDQTTGDWERAWYAFEQMWPDVEISPDLWEPSACEALVRFLRSQVFAGIEQIRDWSGWALRDIKRLLEVLEEDGTIVACEIDELGEGWMLAEDLALDKKSPVRSVFMLHRADPLVRADITWLKESFPGLEVLQFLLIDGDLQGAVCGHWRFGPYDVDDIVVYLPEEERASRRDEIIEAVAWKYHPPEHNILRYNGEPAGERPPSAECD